MGEDNSLCQSSLAGAFPATPLPGPPRGLTCKAQCAKQFLKLLELPWGQEQVQGAQLPTHLQLGVEEATMEPTPATAATHMPSP